MNALTEPTLLQPAHAGDLLASLHDLQQLQRAEPYPSWAQRKARLQRLLQMLLQHRAEIASAISADFGHRSPHETELLEVFPSVEGLRHAMKHGRGWMRKRQVSVSMWFMPSTAAVLPQPVGVVGVIVPWNYPLYLLIGPLVSAITAGNRAMVKLSEYSPRLGELMADLLPKALGHDVVRVVTGGPDVAAAFSALPFGHLLFTGSTTVGRHVMTAAASNLVPVTLELGGKSPAIITAETCADEARFTNAVTRIIVGKALNAGQTCVAPDYVLLPRAAMDRFIGTARQVLATQYPRGAAGADYTGIAADRHFARLNGLLAEATDGGAQATAVMSPAQPGQRKLPLTILTDSPASARVMHEEIFGPLLPLVAAETLNEAIDYINDRPHPLALYLFDDSALRQRHVLKSTLAGGVAINDTLTHLAQDELPFGGVGASGMGHYHGQYGFDAMSKLKPVFRQSRISGAGLLAPPYGSRFASIVKLMVRGGKSS